jgi:hypothetical protein
LLCGSQCEEEAGSESTSRRKQWQRRQSAIEALPLLKLRLGFEVEAPRSKAPISFLVSLLLWTRYVDNIVDNIFRIFNITTEKIVLENFRGTNSNL